jgi:hypothetical protein
MRLLRIKKSATRATLQVDLTGIIKHPILGTHENSIVFKSAFEDAIKYHTYNFAKDCHPNVEFSIGDFPISIQFKNPHVLKEYIGILNGINEGSERIYKKLINSQYLTEIANINAFKEHLYASVLEEIVEHNKNHKTMSFIEVEKSPYSIHIKPNLKELKFVNTFISSNFQTCFIESMVKQLNDYSITYQPNDNLLITVVSDKVSSVVVVTANNQETINDLAQICKKLNQESNKIYDIATTNVALSYFQKESTLTEKFTNLIDGFLVREIMEQHLPSNNNSIAKKKAKI